LPLESQQTKKPTHAEIQKTGLQVSSKEVYFTSTTVKAGELRSRTDVCLYIY